MATPFRPAFSGTTNGGATHTNVSATGNRRADTLPLFAFGPDSVSAEWAGITEPARFYAVEGDLVGVSSGPVNQLWCQQCRTRGAEVVSGVVRRG